MAGNGPYWHCIFTSHEGTPFTPASELLGNGYDLRIKLAITQIPGYRLRKPIEILGYQRLVGNGTIEFAVVHRLPSHAGNSRSIVGYGLTLEEACQKFVDEVVECARSLAPPDSTTDELIQRVLEKEYLTTLLTRE